MEQPKVTHPARASQEMFQVPWTVSGGWNCYEMFIWPGALAVSLEYGFDFSLKYNPDPSI